MSNLVDIDLRDFDEDDLLAGNIIYTETGKTQVISITVKDSERGPKGEGVPTGGTTGEYLVKASDTDYDTEWQTVNIPDKISDLINDSGFITASDIPVTSVNGQTGNVTINVPTKTSELTNDSDFQTSSDTASYIAIHNASLTAHPDIRNKVNAIDDLIPNQASTSNQLADKNFVNSSVQTATANFRGNWSDWADVPTVATSYPVDYAGNRTPTVNDYLVVQDASDYTLETLEGTWRFKYTGTWATDGKAGWHPEYQVNETPLTAAQLAALNSGITAEKVNNMALQSDLPTKTSDLNNDGDGVSPFATVSQLPAPITVDSDLNSTSTNPVENSALYKAVVGKIVNVLVSPAFWSAESGTQDYNSIAIITLPTGSFTDNSLIELVNVSAYNTFAKHGFVCYYAEASSQRVWISSIGKPTTDINFQFRIYEYGS